MDKQRATSIIENTFKQPFDERRFYEFCKNLLNDLDERHSFDYISGDRIKNIFKPHITKYKRLGTYKDPNGDKLDVMVVNLKNEWALERSRTILRNFTADYLKNDDEKDAALVAYYTPNPDDWRFSYIRMEYKQELTESGRIRVREDLTPAKRFSFMVGENEPNHTAQAQLIPILENDRNNPTISDLESSFSVEAVTKQFYKDYRGLYEKLKTELDRIVAHDNKISNEFDAKSIETTNFAKKLLGQIVFLYFLQKKGWLGVKKDESGNFKPWGSGPKDFLRKLFEKKFVKNYENFFNDVLEPLFYVGLASEHEGNYFPLLECRIPFLNGGLFEPINRYNWQETEIVIGNHLIKEVLDTFDRYNFTVREDEPLEKEVAVDPEMLGKVFENLIDENERKGMGAFYTPRTIVHYMCQESLINYLDTACELVSKEDIETLIREGEVIIDLERINEGFTEGQKLVVMDSIKENARELDSALANIKVCDPAIGSGAFPVGMMTEIVKARQVLDLYLVQNKSIYELKRHCIQESLYGVDLDPGAIEIAKLRLWLSLIVDEENYTTIQTLPNLDFKIIQGNSLIEEFHGISLELKEKPKLQMNLLYGDSDLTDLIDDMHHKQQNFFNAKHPKDKYKIREEVEKSIFKIFRHACEEGNISATMEKKEVEKELWEMIHGNKARNFMPWKLYFADIFLEKGGFDIVIANPPYSLNIPTNEKELLRQYFKTLFFKINLFTCFIELATLLIKKSGILCFINPSMFFANDSLKLLRKYLAEELSFIQLINLGDGAFEQVTMPTMITIVKNQKNINNNFEIFLGAKSFPIMSEGILIRQNEILESYNNVIEIISERDKKIVKKLYNGSEHLENYLDINQGIITGNDKKHLSNNCETKNYKPTIRGRDIVRYGTNYPKLFVNYNPTDLACPRTPLLFNCEEKILIRRTADSPVASLDLKQTYNLHTLYSCRTKVKIDIKYLLGIINCKLIKFCYQKQLGAEIGRTFAEIKILYIRKLPIKGINKQDTLIICGIVDKILSAKKTNTQADITVLEAEIDQLVYQLYGLTDEEIKIVEESVEAP
jgi:type I restriction-modification system DNA methylase subunit